MHPNSPPPVPIPAYFPTYPEMAAPDSPNFFPTDPAPSSFFDATDFFDFNLDEALDASLLQPGPGSESGHDRTQPAEILGHVRKRDPRLVCSNFLAGRVPCACPEMDEKLAEEESGLPGKKRARMARASLGGPARCQVPGCEADITELKGYHKRHRVCLQCANAKAVMLDGESKRYCQQCGKFHLLSDFDEGRRSCRRKLQWHNQRRRRKSNDSKGGTEKGSPQIISADDVSGDDDTGKDVVHVNDRTDEREMLLEPDGHISTLCLENVHGDSIASLAASGGTHTDGDKQISDSPICCDVNRNAYSSMCPSGRISFKLYDWNPAEFPRRLRLQIFQWLASMPIELEGYIRPGCTILTAFISMPKPTWLKLLKEPALCIKELVSSPGNMLSGRGTMLVYVNDMVFRVTKDAKSVFKVNVKDESPKLHYIHPSWFEAGQAMEFVACGSRLLQPKFRFLVSFTGRYLAYNIRVSSVCCKKNDGKSSDHQLLKITVPQNDTNHFGAAFIEVENQSGLSNFLPILIGDKETCAEIEILRQKLDILPSQDQPFLSKPPCEVFTTRQAQFSDFILDLAWSLKKPASDQPMSSFHVQRLNRVLTFLLDKDSRVILERILDLLKSAVDDNLVADISDADKRLLLINMRIAQNILDQKPFVRDSARSRNSYSKVMHAREFSPSPEAGCNTDPLLNNDVVMNVRLQTRPKSCSQMLTRSFLTLPRRQAAVAVVVAIGICCTVCTVVLHPQGVNQIATTIRRCLFDNDTT